jgi:Delta3-Delta2-enoyl-CoA isomerase
MNLEGPTKDGVFVLRFQNGLKENRMNREFFVKLNQALDVVEKKRDNAAIVIVGSGKFFSNGMDMSYLKNNFEEAVDLMQKTLLRLTLFGVPVVACLNGHTIAGGAILSLCADVRVMTNQERRYFWINEVALGVPITGFIASIVQQKVPSHVQNRLLLQSHRFSSNDALRFGIVDEVQSNPESRSIEIAKSLAGRNRQAWALSKRRMYSLRYDPVFRAFGGLKPLNPPKRDEAGILYDVNEKTGVATIQLNRPRRGNAW